MKKFIIILISCLLSYYSYAQEVAKAMTLLGEATLVKTSKETGVSGSYEVTLGKYIYWELQVTMDNPNATELGAGTYKFSTPSDQVHSFTYTVQKTEKGYQIENTGLTGDFYLNIKNTPFNSAVAHAQLGSFECTKNQLIPALLYEVVALYAPEQSNMGRENSTLDSFTVIAEVDLPNFRNSRKAAYKEGSVILKYLLKLDQVTNKMELTVNANSTKMTLTVTNDELAKSNSATVVLHYDITDSTIALAKPLPISPALNSKQLEKLLGKQLHDTQTAPVINILYESLNEELKKIIRQNPNEKLEIDFIEPAIYLVDQEKTLRTALSDEQYKEKEQAEMIKFKKRGSLL